MTSRAIHNRSDRDVQHGTLSKTPVFNNPSVQPAAQTTTHLNDAMCPKKAHIKQNQCFHQSQCYPQPTWAKCDPKWHIKENCCFQQSIVKTVRHPKLEWLQVAHEFGSKHARLSAKTPTQYHPFKHCQQPLASNKQSLQHRPLWKEMALLWVLWNHLPPCWAMHPGQTPKLFHAQLFRLGRSENHSGLWAARHPGKNSWKGQRFARLCLLTVGKILFVSTGPPNRDCDDAFGVVTQRERALAACALHCSIA